MTATYAKERPAGALATASWLSARGLLVSPHLPWDVSIALDVTCARAPARYSDASETRLHIAIASTEWGIYFCHHSRASWIRVTDLPFVHERDDFGLLAGVPPLRDVGSLVRSLEEKHEVSFRREHAAIRSTLPNAEPAVREWVLSVI